MLFFLIRETLGVKTYWKNVSRPSRFRAIQVNIYHVVIHSSLYAS